jgi:phage-related holin
MKTLLQKSDSEIEMNFYETIYPFLLKFTSMLVLVLLPVRPVMIAVSVLIIADFITGVWASRKLKEPITSSGFKQTVIKTLAYQSAVVIAFVMETYLLEGVPVVKVVAGLIALTEGKSFFENIHRITGVDFWSEALNKLQTATAKALPAPGEVIETLPEETLEPKPRKKRQYKKKPSPKKRK